MRILTRKQFQDDMARMWSEAVHAEYKAQIEAAVLEEREACAKIAEEWAVAYPHPAQTIAVAIRMQGGEK